MAESALNKRSRKVPTRYASDYYPVSLCTDMHTFKKSRAFANIIVDIRFVMKLCDEQDMR